MFKYIIVVSFYFLSKNKEIHLKIHKKQETREFTTLFCKGDMPEARKNHIAVIVGNQILIHGGMSSFSKCLKDVWILDLSL